jgi:hypothetical protein
MFTNMTSPARWSGDSANQNFSDGPELLHCVRLLPLLWLEAIGKWLQHNSSSVSAVREVMMMMRISPRVYR